MKKKTSVNDSATVGLDSIVQDMVDNIPDVQQHLVNAEAEELKIVAQSDNNATTGNHTDANNDVFNPAIHLVDKDGNPVKTKLGKFRRAKKKINGVEEEKPQEAQIALADSKAAAEVVQSLKRSVYDNFFDFKYNEARHNMHVDVTTTYFMSEGGVKLTPLQTLLILEGAMGVELFKTEKGAKKITGLKSWMADKVIKFKDRKKGKKQDDTHASSRTDAIGENDNSGTNGS